MKIVKVVYLPDGGIAANGFRYSGYGVTYSDGSFKKILKPTKAVQKFIDGRTPRKSKNKSGKKILVYEDEEND